MAPNRKTHELFADAVDLESLKTSIQPKYLPLTIGHDPRETQEVQQQPKCNYQQELVTDPKTEKEPRAVSYWDWPADTIEAEKEAAVDDLFSLSRIESNLVTDSFRRETATKDVTTNTEESQSYWEWSTDVNVVECETDSEDNADAATSQNRPDRHCEDCCQEYWTWSEESNHDEASMPSRSDHLHSILDSSRKKYQRRHSHLPDPENPDTNTEHASDHYWHWSEFHSTSATQ